MKLIALWLFATLMKTMVSRIPEIASVIASSPLGIQKITNQLFNPNPARPEDAINPQNMYRNVETSFRVGAGALGGGGIGGEAGAAVAQGLGGSRREQAMARQGGGVAGAMMGIMVTKRK